MSNEKKSILEKLFKNSGGCSCGVEIVEEGKEKETETDDSNEEKTK